MEGEMKNRGLLRGQEAQLGGDYGRRQGEVSKTRDPAIIPVITV